MSKKFCPLLNKKCIEHKCAWYTNIAGTNPQTGEVFDKWECSITFIPMLQIEQTKAALGNQAATVAVNNSVAKVAEAAYEARKIEPVQVKLLTDTLLCQ